MGGPGSGSQPEHEGAQRRGGRQKQAAVAVVGTGTPVKPADIDDEIGEHWDYVVSLIPKGVACSEDSIAVFEMAVTNWLQAKLLKQLQSEMTVDPEVVRIWQANGRHLREYLTQFASTPRSRQITLIPAPESEKPKSKLSQFKKI